MPRPFTGRGSCLGGLQERGRKRGEGRPEVREREHERGVVGRATGGHDSGGGVREHGDGKGTATKRARRRRAATARRRRRRPESCQVPRASRAVPRGSPGGPGRPQVGNARLGPYSRRSIHAISGGWGPRGRGRRRESRTTPPAHARRPDPALLRGQILRRALRVPSAPERGRELAVDGDELRAAERGDAALVEEVGLPPELGAVVDEELVAGVDAPRRLRGNQTVSWVIPTKLQNSLSRPNRRRFG